MLEVAVAYKSTIDQIRRIEQQDSISFMNNEHSHCIGMNVR